MRRTAPKKRHLPCRQLPETWETLSRSRAPELPGLYPQDSWELEVGVPPGMVTKLRETEDDQGRTVKLFHRTGTTDHSALLSDVASFRNWLRRVFGTATVSEWIMTRAFWTPTTPQAGQPVVIAPQAGVSVGNPAGVQKVSFEGPPPVEPCPPLSELVSEFLGSPATPASNACLDAAKEMAMLERNAQGKEARRYFIACERALRASLSSPQFQLPQTYAEALRAHLDAVETNDRLKLENSKVVEALAVETGQRQSVEACNQEIAIADTTLGSKTAGTTQQNVKRSLAGCFRDRAARPEGRTTPPTEPDERN